MHSCAHAMRAHGAPHATGLPLLPVVCLLVTMGMDMNEWLIAWIVLLKAVRAVCAPKSVFNPHGNHGIAWSCIA